MLRFLFYILIALASCLPTLATTQVSRATTQSATGFDTWQRGFRIKAIAAGISGTTFDAAFSDIRYDQNTGNNDAGQPEFIRPIWDYLDSAVSPSHVSAGKSKAVNLRKVLANIERQFGVDSKILLAIWGIETNYGTFRGRIYTIEALANAAYFGRRRIFAESELIAALKILNRGDLKPSDMLGGWSGAMGHTQFMPSTYLRFAVDYNLDGRRDVWSDNPADALASSANYLHQLGWKKGQPWGIEVILPAGFDYAQIGEYNTRNANYWNMRGVRTTSGQKIPTYGATAILAPAGAKGPIFAIFPNFQVIRQYNRSVSYAIAVGHLSDRIEGGGPFTAKWPRNEMPMTRADQRELQTLLHKRGFNIGVVDGMVGPKTIAAIQAYQLSVGLLADGYATQKLLNRLRP